MGQMTVIELIDQLKANEELSRGDLLFILNNLDETSKKHLYKEALNIKTENYGDTVYMRGLIEFTNYCTQTCTYCGISRHNPNVDRYRLTKEQIMDCAEEGHRLGYRTFVLQGGEDPHFTDEILVDIITTLRETYPDSAITLSIGERSIESYKRLKEAGADRYLLRHETAARHLYEKFHPGMSFDNRRNCLKNIKEVGFQVGSGFLVGLPGQSNEDLVEDLLFLKELNPHMTGIGPFIPHKETPLGHSEGGTVEKTRIMLALTRLMLPKVLLPSTTAMGTLDPLGREKALKSGANVVMPNLSPTDVREKYELYQDKICTGDAAAHCRGCIERRINNAGFIVDMSRGDYDEWRKKNVY